jgi:N-acetylmuramoyl-L-alanine amidase
MLKAYEPQAGRVGSPSLRFQATRLLAAAGLMLLSTAPLFAQDQPPIVAATPEAAQAEPPIQPVIVPPTQVTARDAKVVGDGARTRFVMDLSGSTPLSVFTLDNPDRVVVDLPETHFQLAEGAGKTGKGLVSAFRYGLISLGKSRIVLDATGPVAVDKAFVLPPADGEAAKLVIDLVPSTRAKFTEAVRQYRDSDKSTPKEHVAEAAPAPADGRLRIVLDPGHGGIDSGAIGKSGTFEKKVVLAFAQILKAKLEESGRYEVMMTRSDDTFVPLGGRVAFARARHADLFISIHADSFWGTDIRGATVYTLSEKASDQMAAQIAESENKSDILAGVDVPEDTSDVSDILIDLARRETKSFAVVFARNMIKELKPDVQLFKRAHQQAGFVVLKAPDVPSALVELGYLSNAADEKLLNSDEWRGKTSIAIARAIDDYFRMRVAQTTTGSIANEIGEP